MHTKLLIDAIVRQTTVLIAQLSTAAGIRAPLAHVADQVFLELSRELEAQGLGKRVVADMFGLLIRGYQKKVQRLTESASIRDRSLWEAVLEFVTTHPGTSRDRVLERFARDGEDAVASVLNDLVTSGLVFRSGHGRKILYRPTTEEDRLALVDADSQESLTLLVWATVFHNPGISLEGLADRIRADSADLAAAVDGLRAEGRVDAEDWPTYRALRTRELLVPMDSEVGWEAAVLDHFQAVSNAISAKVRSRRLKSAADDAVGGATLRFELGEGNPHAQEVFGLLAEIRRRVNHTWEKVRAYNAANPVAEGLATNVCFYFGQYVTEPDDE